LADFFLYLVLFLVSLWTARLAMSKGKNPWAWGGSALLLSLMPWHLLGVIPVLILLFIKNPTTSPAVRPDRLSCPRCAKSHSGGQHFCTGCGWDLTAAYTPEEPGESQQSPAQPQAQTSTLPSAVAEPPEVSSAPAPGVGTTQSPASEPDVTEAQQADQEAVPATGLKSTANSPQELVEDTGEPTEATETAEAEDGQETEYVPWGTYAPGVAPTAAVMTARGIERFDEGKYQEAIDQFTKAIALDPNYAEAWQRRAEAYAQLGRSEQAAEDRRHLQGLDPSSSPG
jgi:hypothetical protein